MSKMFQITIGAYLGNDNAPSQETLEQSRDLISDLILDAMMQGKLFVDPDVGGSLATGEFEFTFLVESASESQALVLAINGVDRVMRYVGYTETGDQRITDASVQRTDELLPA